MAASSVARSLQTWRATRNTAVHHPSPTNLSQMSFNSLLPMVTFQPCLSGGGILNVVASFILRPQQEEVNLQGHFPALLPRWRHQDGQDPGRPYSTLEMLPQNLTVFQLQGHLLPHFPNSPKPRPIIVIVVSPNLPGHLPALFRELGQLRQRLLSSPAIQNLGSFPLTLLYSKSSRLPSSPSPGGNYRKVAVPSTSGSHNLRMSPPEI